MQQLRLIKGRSYLIDGVPHLFQEREKSIYRFLKIDGSQKYLYENDLGKVKLTLQDEAYEQKLRDAESEISYYREKYGWYQEKEKQEEIQKKYTDGKKSSWFADSMFARISMILTLAAIVIAAFQISIDAGRKSDNFGVGILTFVGILIGAIIISLFVAWLAYKAEELMDEETKSHIVIKLLFFLPVMWVALFKIFQILFSSSAGVEE
jgi:hypothetical protein